MALATFRDIVIDCANPVELAKFWTRVLGYPVIRQDEDEACLDAGDGSFRIWLVRVPEPKTVKNRAHIDVNLQPGASIEQLVELGAEVLHPGRPLGRPRRPRTQRVLRLPTAGGRAGGQRLIGRLPTSLRQQTCRRAPSSAWYDLAGSKAIYSFVVDIMRE